MSYLGEYRGRKKALPTVRLVPDGAGMATLYKDGVMVGAPNSVAYSPAAWTELFTALANVMTVNMIEIFDSTGNSGQIGLGAAGLEAQFILVTPGGNGVVTARIDSGLRIALKPNVTPTANTEILINFYD